MQARPFRIQLALEAIEIQKAKVEKSVDQAKNVDSQIIYLSREAIRLANDACSLLRRNSSNIDKVVKTITDDLIKTRNLYLSIKEKRKYLAEKDKNKNSEILLMRIEMLYDAFNSHILVPHRKSKLVPHPRTAPVESKQVAPADEIKKPVQTEIPNNSAFDEAINTILFDCRLAHQTYDRRDASRTKKLAELKTQAIQLQAYVEEKWQSPDQIKVELDKMQKLVNQQITWFKHTSLSRTRASWYKFWTPKRDLSDAEIQKLVADPNPKNHTYIKLVWRIKQQVDAAVESYKMFISDHTPQTRQSTSRKP